MRRLRVAALCVVVAALAGACESSVAGNASFTGPNASSTGTDQPTLPTKLPTTHSHSSAHPTSPPPKTTRPHTTAPHTTSPVVAERTRVCAHFTLLIVQENGALRPLPPDATLDRRRAVAKTFSTVQRQMINTLHGAKLAGHDIVEIRGNEVAHETGKVASLLQSGSAFTNTSLLGAQHRFNTACSR